MKIHQNMKMSNKKEQLKNSDQALKKSLEEQLSDLKENFGDAGKNALWIGGGLAVAFGLMKLLSGEKKKKRAKKITIQQAEKVPETEATEAPKKENLMSSALKEQLIVFLLGIATERLTKFLSELDTEKVEDGPE